jgi:hypothetical protein
MLPWLRLLFVFNGAATVKRPLIRPSATFSPTKSVGEKALDWRVAWEV